MSCVMSGTVFSSPSESSSYSGGLVGYQREGGTVSSSQSFSVLRASGSSSSYVGGFVGGMFSGGTVDRSLFYGVGVGATSTDVSVGSHVGAQSGSGHILSNNLVISESVFFDVSTLVTDIIGGTPTATNTCNIQASLASVLSTTSLPADSSCDEISPTAFFEWSFDNWSFGSTSMLPYLDSLNQSDQFYAQGSGFVWLYQGT